MRPAFRGEPLERVMRYVQYDTNGGCWLWDSGVTTNGHLEYPTFTLRAGKQERVNRFMYRSFKGPIPDGLIVRHTCDVSLCVNPAHLILGTHKQNADDREARGRTHRGPREPGRIHCANGHLWNDGNIAFERGRLRCVTCRRAAKRRFNERQGVRR